MFFVLFLGIMILLWFLFGFAVLFALFLAPAGIATLVWKKTRSRVLYIVALIVAFTLPNLRWLTTRIVFALKEREPHHEILEVIERPESLFIQNDLQSAPFGIGLREPDRDGEMAETLDAPYRWENRVETLRAYLDGEHLTALALTDDKGGIHLYQGAVAPFFEPGTRCWKEDRAATKAANALEAEARRLAEKTGVAALEEPARQLRVEAGNEYWRHRRHCLSLPRQTERTQCLKTRTELQQNAERSAGELEEKAAALARETGVAALRERARTLRDMREDCDKRRRQDIADMDRSARVFESSADLPPMRYRMRLHQETVWFLRSLWPLYHVHRMEIRDEQSGKRVAWARRHYAPAWWLTGLCGSLFLADPPPNTFEKGPGNRWLEGVVSKAFGGYPRENREKVWRAERGEGTD